MSRWEPNASGRLRQAAMELYVERGFEQTTVADIADRAGLTGRTFFRYFADKREVLFAGSIALQEHLVAALDGAPPSSSPMQAVAVALDAAAVALGQHHALSHQRQVVIAANVELRERELAKMATLARALADGLRRRGVDDARAHLAAETGIAVLRVAFERWVGGPPGEQSLELVMGETLGQLKSLNSD